MNTDNQFISYSVRSFNETDVVLSKILKADCSIQTDDVINDYQRKIDELEKENRTLKKNIKLISSHMKDIPLVECHKGWGNYDYYFSYSRVSNIRNFVRRLASQFE